MNDTAPSRDLPVALQQLPTVKNQVELTKALDQLKQHFNVLVPAQMNFSSPLHKVALEAVQLDARVDEKKNGVDIYSPEGGDKYTLHYKAANKIAGAAGINWTSSEVVRRDVGDDGRAIYIEHSVAWEVKRPNGSTKKGVTSGFYRYEEDKKKFTNPKQIEGRRRFAEALAESNAKLRGIFEALEQLPRAFTLEELKKPFLVPCVIEDINELAKDDPEIRRMIAAQALGITDQLYGPGRAQVKPDTKEIQGAAVVLDDSSVEDNSYVDKKTGEIKLPEDIYKKEARSQPREDKVAQVKRLVKAKNFTPTAGSRPPEELPDDVLVEYLWHLYSLPDAAPVAAQSPLPWKAGA
jgi:hypothetical protein